MSTPLPVPDGPRRAGSPPPPADFDQDPADILQETDGYDVKAVPVCLEEPVRSILLPARAAAFRSYEVDTVTAQKILERDPRRKRAVITAHDDTDAGTAHGIYLGSTQASANTQYGFLLPFTVRGTGLGAGTGPLEITAIDEVWAITEDSGAGTVIVSVLNEQWAD